MLPQKLKRYAYRWEALICNQNGFHQMAGWFQSDDELSHLGGEAYVRKVVAVSLALKPQKIVAVNFKRKVLR